MIRTNSTEEHLKQLEIAVKLENVTVEFDGIPRLLNINLEIPAGVIMAIIGPNNSGKTTLLRTICGVIKPVAGNVHIFSRPCMTLKNDIAYVPARKFVNWDFPISLYDLVLMGSYNRIKKIKYPGKKDKISAQEAIERVGLTHIMRKNIKELTRGEKHRALIARALVQDPRIFLMDEPMVATDDESDEIIINILKELKQVNKTLIIAHHNFLTIPQYFDMATLLNVNMIATGNVNDILTNENLVTFYGDKAVNAKNVQSNITVKE